MNKKDLISLMDLSPEEVQALVALACDYHAHPTRFTHALKDQHVGLWFLGSSTRTRTSFEIAAHRLGAHTVFYRHDELQTHTGESIEDTGRVLSQFLEALIVRTNSHIKIMKTLAAVQSHMSVVNAMSACEHPTQVIGDIVTIIEHRGSLRGTHILYVGEGNNTASALAYVCSSLPDMKLTLMCPPGYGLPNECLRRAVERAEGIGAQILPVDSPTDIPRNLDYVYTTRWETMGVKHTDPNWRDIFMPFQVNRAFMEAVKTNSPRAVSLMHDLPAIRGLDVTNEVLDGPASIVLRQAAHKVTGAAATLLWVRGDTGR